LYTKKNSSNFQLALVHSSLAVMCPLGLTIRRMDSAILVFLAPGTRSECYVQSKRFDKQMEADSLGVDFRVESLKAMGNR
jgi:hypothetical protein